MWYTGNGWLWKGALEANIRECWLADGKLNPGAAVPPKAGQEIMQSAQSNPPDFSKVKAPVLNLIAVRKQHPALKPDDSEENKKRAVEFWQAMTEFRRAYADHVKKAMPSLKTVEIDGDHGQFFHEREDDVVREMRAFLLEP